MTIWYVRPPVDAIRYRESFPVSGAGKIISLSSAAALSGPLDTGTYCMWGDTAFSWDQAENPVVVWDTEPAKMLAAAQLWFFQMTGADNEQIGALTNGATGKLYIWPVT